jgi:hypothetical protein
VCRSWKGWPRLMSFSSCNYHWQVESIVVSGEEPGPGEESGATWQQLIADESRIPGFTKRLGILIPCTIQGPPSVAYTALI